ncbi:MAG: universal stress protein [Proteobacteria bacterium]|nr:universal stress protein [Pseudomonadota bacterium]
MKRFGNILLLAEGNCWQDSALLRAVELAEHNQADLTIISPMNIPNALCGLTDSDCRRFINAAMDVQKGVVEEQATNASPGLNITIKIIEGGIFPEIIREVLRNDFDLVMKAAEETGGLHEKIFGSADMHLLRKCPCPVWIIHSDGKGRYKRIFAAVDVESDNGDETVKNLNKEILEIASSLALSEFCELHIVHAWTAWGENFLNTPRFRLAESGKVAEWVEHRRVADEKKMNDLVNTLTEIVSPQAIDYIKPQLHIVKGQVHQVISDLLQDQQNALLVMGTVARTGISGVIMGNTAESILNNIGCSVLAIKPPGFVTPVTL